MNCKQVYINENCRGDVYHLECPPNPTLLPFRKAVFIEDKGKYREIRENRVSGVDLYNLLYDLSKTNSLLRKELQQQLPLPILIAEKEVEYGY